MAVSDAEVQAAVTLAETLPGIDMSEIRDAKKEATKKEAAKKAAKNMPAAKKTIARKPRSA
ncbi:hypothetical protein [Streptomyces sp. cmx-4-9]|uniref:hypothetical protein n=1 Tax=Streptomyces sp. cmx-4-9 TaxID=2790941 RepID=UPI0039803477